MSTYATWRTARGIVTVTCNYDSMFEACKYTPSLKTHRGDVIYLTRERDEETFEHVGPVIETEPSLVNAWVRAISHMESYSSEPLEHLLDLAREHWPEADMSTYADAFTRSTGRPVYGWND